MERGVLDATWKRDIYHNYFILTETGEHKDSFQEKMIEYNHIEGIVPFQVIRVDKQKQYQYEVTGYQTIDVITEKVPLKLNQVKSVLTQLLIVLKEAQKYLLETKEFVLLPEYTFIHLPEYKLGLCYYPGYQIPFREQLVSFLEFLMGRVDYEDKSAVLFVYTLYMKSKEENLTLKELKAMVECREDSEEVDFSDGDVDFSENDILTTKYGLNKPDHVNKAGQVRGQETKSNPIDRLGQGTKLHEIHKLLQEKSRRHENKQNTATKHENRDEILEKASKGVSQGLRRGELPFVKEKQEEESEVYYYPLVCYLLYGILVFIGIFLIVIAYQKGLMYQNHQSKIDIVKVVALLIVVTAILSYAFIKIFSKERKQSKIITTASYHIPTIEEILDSSYTKEYEETEEKENKREIKKEDRYEKSGESSKGDGFIEGGFTEEEGTILLTVNELSYDSLIPVDTANFQKIQLIEYPFFIGTAKNNQGYHLSNSVISRFHAKFEKDEEKIVVTDLGSTNGTFLNGAKILPNEYVEVHHGDTISFANISYSFSHT